MMTDQLTTFSWRRYHKMKRWVIIQDR